MATRRLKKPLLMQRVEVVDITEDGRGIAKHDGKVVFVDKAVPGDVIDIQVQRRKRSLFEGVIEKLVEASPVRTTPFCDHFGLCGGCKWQHLDYAAQLKYKQKHVADALQRLAGIDTSHINPILPSEQSQYYRNKLEFTFSNRRWLSKEDMQALDEQENPNLNSLGFHVPGRFDKLVDVQHCYLQADPSNAIRNAVREYALGNKLSFYDLKAHGGLLRNLIIRTASTGELMVIMVFAEQDEQAIEGLMGHLQITFPEITSLLYIVNQKLNDTIFDQEVHCWHGRDHIFEEMQSPGGTVRFKIGPKSFYQTNSTQAQHLYEVAADFAGLKGDELVYDLYTGAGTIANFIASSANKVIGIEYVPSAIDDAKENSELNNIQNTLFYAGDMKEVLTDDFVLQHGHPDVIITDPPRAGMHADVVSCIARIAPQKIVYVSCNPSTQARDLLLLKEQYEVSRIQPVDMFPQTTHVENVILLEKKKSE